MTRKYHFSFDQKSSEWTKKHLGVISSSRVNSLLAKPDTKTFLDLVKDVYLEKKYGVKTNFGANTEWIARGTLLEPIARQEYINITKNSVTEVGCVEFEGLVASPDGLVGHHGILEIKCPKDTTQEKYLKSQKVPTNYYRQIQFQLLVTNRPWAHFFSYHPDMSHLLIKVDRDNVAIGQIIDRLAYFNAQVDGYIEPGRNKPLYDAHLQNDLSLIGF